jgi:hypothetical protein
MVGLTPGGIAVSGDAIGLSFVVAGLLLLAFVVGVWAGRRPVDVLDQFDTLKEVSAALADDADLTGFMSRGVDPGVPRPRRSVLPDGPPRMPSVKTPKWPHTWVDLVEAAYSEPVPAPMPNCGACKSAMTACTTPAVCRAVARLYPTSTN